MISKASCSSRLMSSSALQSSTARKLTTKALQGWRRGMREDCSLKLGLQVSATEGASVVPEESGMQSSSLSGIRIFLRFGRNSAFSTLGKSKLGVFFGEFQQSILLFAFVQVGF
jgi:hypothetical protein